MENQEAADILRSIADRNEAAIGDLGTMDYDTRKLVESSGRLLLVEALRMGADALNSGGER